MGSVFNWAERVDEDRVARIEYLARHPKSVNPTHIERRIDGDKTAVFTLRFGLWTGRGQARATFLTSRGTGRGGRFPQTHMKRRIATPAPSFRPSGFSREHEKTPHHECDGALEYERKNQGRSPADINVIAGSGRSTIRCPLEVRPFRERDSSNPLDVSRHRFASGR